MRLTPIVALVDDESMVLLSPLIEELIARWQTGDVDQKWQRTMVENGWTPEMIAWGLVIGAASKQLHP